MGAAAAKLVAAFHSLQVPPEFEPTRPLLWTWLERMMEEIEESASADALPVSVQVLRGEVDRMAAAVRDDAAGAARMLRVVLAHGDLKPTNVMLVSQEPEVELTLIDFELSGPNYRGFDLMKLFRTSPETYCEERFVAFIAQYCQAAGLGETAVHELEAETKVFEPLTWLEAAVFFALVIVKGGDTPENVALLTDRWEKYQAKKWMVDHYLRILGRHRTWK